MMRIEIQLKEYPPVQQGMYVATPTSAPGIQWHLYELWPDLCHKFKVVYLMDKRYANRDSQRWPEMANGTRVIP